MYTKRALTPACDHFLERVYMMAETYCGKSCSECSQKDVLYCFGCKAGPGRLNGGACELAKCCREKGHETCDTCGSKAYCSTLRTRDQQPEIRKAKTESNKIKKETLAERALFLGKWLWILFWLVVPATIAGIMKNENIMKVAPGVYLAGQILNAACSVVYGAILLKLSSAESNYRTAGILTLITAGVSILSTVLFGASEEPSWAQLIIVPAAVVGLFREYFEYKAHSCVLMGTDNDLSERWTKLWKWFIYCTIGIIGGAVLILFAPLIGAVLLIVALVGWAIVSIVKLVYLYRTAKMFRR